MAEDPEDEETVDVEVDLAEGKPLNPMEEMIASVPSVANMQLDLTKDEKLRTTALMLAVRYHQDTVVKEGELYQQMKMDQKQLRTTSAKIVVEYAWEFEQYLRGESEVVKRLEEAFMERLERRLAEQEEEEDEHPDDRPAAPTAAPVPPN